MRRGCGEGDTKRGDLTRQPSRPYSVCELLDLREELVPQNQLWELMVITKDGNLKPHLWSVFTVLQRLETLS